MDQTLSNMLLIAGALGWLLALASSRFRAPRAHSASVALTSQERGHWILLGAMAFAVLALTLPSRPPFAPGAAFGPGFALAVSLWMLTGWLHRQNKDLTPVPFLWSGFLAASLPGLFWSGHGETEALLGAGAGMVVSTLLLCLPETEQPAWSKAIQRGALFGTALVSASMLGLLRPGLTSATSPQDPALWQSCALALGLLTALTVTLACFLAPKFQGAPGFLARLSGALWSEDTPALASALVVAATLATAAAAFLALQILEEPLLAAAYVLGLGAGALTLTLSRDSGAENSSAVATPLAMLVVLAAFMAGFGLLQGYGAAVVLLGAAVPVVLAPAQRSGPATRALLFGLALVVYRLFATRYGDQLRGVSLADNYALFATVAGLLLPQVPALWSREGQDNSLPRTLGGGLVALVMPAALILFYGGKVGPALLVGLALATALRGGRLLAWWALAMGFAIVEGTRHLLPLAELTRNERLQLLVLVAGAAGLLLVGTDLANRMNKR